MSALAVVKARLEAREWPTADEYLALLDELKTPPAEAHAEAAKYRRNLPASQSGEQKLLAALRSMSLQ